MPTPRQEKLAEAIIENMASDKPKSKIELAVSSGYALSTAEGGVKDIVEQKGVQEALVVRGFTVENAKRVVSDLMLDEQQDGNVRLKAADMTFKVHGSYAPEKQEVKSVNVDVSVTSEEALKLTEEYEQRLKGSLAQ